MRISISKEAYKRLKLVADYDSSSLSETILYYVPEEYALQAEEEKAGD